MSSGTGPCVESDLIAESALVLGGGEQATYEVENTVDHH